METQRTIWKFPFTSPMLVLDDLVAPRVLHVGVDPASDHGWPTVWVSHVVAGDGYTYSEPTPIKLIVVGTDMHYRSGNALYVGSVVMPSDLVWHVFEDISYDGD